MKNSLPRFHKPGIDPYGQDPFTAGSEFVEFFLLASSYSDQFDLVQFVINFEGKTDYRHGLITINPEVGSGSIRAPPHSADRINTPAWLEPTTFSFQGHSVYLVF